MLKTLHRQRGRTGRSVCTMSTPTFSRVEPRVYQTRIRRKLIETINDWLSKYAGITTPVHAERLLDNAVEAIETSLFCKKSYTASLRYEEAIQAIMTAILYAFPQYRDVDKDSVLDVAEHFYAQVDHKYSDWYDIFENGMRWTGYEYLSVECLTQTVIITNLGDARIFAYHDLLTDTGELRDHEQVDRLKADLREAVLQISEQTGELIRDQHYFV